MRQNMGASPVATGLSQQAAEPEEVSALRASIPSAVDREIEALRTAYLALASISPGAQSRGLEWLLARFAWEHREGVKAALAVRAVAQRLRRPFRRKRASAGEAGTATTVQQGVVHEHATAATSGGDAQPQSGVNRHG